ncbi:YcjF family protein [Rubrivivax sp. JA1026]|uniref:YcjF family protein n=1 Tax=Rubrivivax sp. JA1026 TaxID=2710888 RepID=UPI0013E9032D|nr:DUF533 domain-containing protein [Rubrivivax sp. JA1026]
MNTADTRAVLTIALLAAFADGRKHEREREQIRRIAEGLAQDAAVDLPSLVQDVLLKRVDVASAAAALGSAEARQLAYEMAVGVCDADGTQSDAERAFLADLARRLGLDDGEAGAYAAQAETLASADVAGEVVETAPADTVARPARPAVDEAELDRAILNAAILNGALELLPESLSTLAIIPLQMKLVHRVGLAYGYPLDSGHVKDFLATAGVGLTSQYLEQAGRKLLGGLLGRVGGGLLGGLGKQAVSSGLSFATTWALGQVAKRYYAGGRTFSTEMLRSTYTELLQQARGLQSQYAPQIQQQARTLDVQKVMAMVRGGR